MTRRVWRTIAVSMALALASVFLFLTPSGANAVPVTERDNRPCVAPVEYFTAAAHYTPQWTIQQFNELFDAPGVLDRSIDITIDNKHLDFYRWKICNYTAKDAILAIGVDSKMRPQLMDFERNRGFSWSRAGKH